MKAEYIDHIGSDLRVANAARVSMGKHKEEFGDDDARLIKYLATGMTEEQREVAVDTVTHDSIAFEDYEARAFLNSLDVPKHFTPFTHCMITLRETVPIFVARQRFKHTVGFTYNEVSRRYVDDTPEFYIPDEWRERPEGSIKQGSSGMSVLSDHYRVRYHQYVDQAVDLYNDMIYDGIAPEQARMVLPQSMMTTYYATGSLFAFARAYKLRADSHAQYEIQLLAKQWDEIIRPLFPVSWQALVGGWE